MTPTVKLVTLITTVTAVGGGVVIANQVFNKEEEIKEPTVRETLQKEGFTILNTTKDKETAEWSELFKAYQTTTGKTFTNVQETKKTEEQLRKDCKEALDKDSKQGNYESLAKKWCVKKESISKILQNRGYTPLKLSSAEESEEKKHWTKKVKKLQENKGQFKDIESEIKDGTDTGIIDANIATLKKGCTSLKIENTDTTADEFENNLALAREWCSIETKQ